MKERITEFGRTVESLVEHPRTEKLLACAGSFYFLVMSVVTFGEDWRVAGTCLVLATFPVTLAGPATWVVQLHRANNAVRGLLVLVLSIFFGWFLSLETPGQSAIGVASGLILWSALAWLAATISGSRLRRAQARERDNTAQVIESISKRLDDLNELLRSDQDGSRRLLWFAEHSSDQVDTIAADVEHLRARDEARRR